MTTVDNSIVVSPSIKEQEECLDAILHHCELTYAEMKPEVYKFCMDLWMEQEKKSKQAMNHEDVCVKSFS